MIAIKRFYYIKAKGDALIITGGLNLGHMPLIWENGGLYGIIRQEIVGNIIRELEDKEKLPGINKSLSMVHVFWDDAVIIDPKIAKILLNQC